MQLQARRAAVFIVMARIRSAADDHELRYYESAYVFDIASERFRQAGVRWERRVNDLVGKAMRSDAYWPGA